MERSCVSQYDDDALNGCRQQDRADDPGQEAHLVMPHDVVDQVSWRRSGRTKLDTRLIDHQQQAKGKHPAARTHQRPDFRQDFAQLRLLLALRRIRRHASGGRF